MNELGDINSIDNKTMDGGDSSSDTTNQSFVKTPMEDLSSSLPEQLGLGEGPLNIQDLMEMGVPEDIIPFGKGYNIDKDIPRAPLNSETKPIIVRENDYKDIIPTHIPLRIDKYDDYSVALRTGRLIDHYNTLWYEFRSLFNTSELLKKNIQPLLLREFNIIDEIFSAPTSDDDFESSGNDFINSSYNNSKQVKNEERLKEYIPKASSIKIKEYINPRNSQTILKDMNDIDKSKVTKILLQNSSFSETKMMVAEPIEDTNTINKSQIDSKPGCGSGIKQFNDDTNIEKIKTVEMSDLPSINGIKMETVKRIQDIGIDPRIGLPDLNGLENQDIINLITELELYRFKGNCQEKKEVAYTMLDQLSNVGRDTNLVELYITLDKYRVFLLKTDILDKLDKLIKYKQLILRVTDIKEQELLSLDYVYYNNMFQIPTKIDKLYLQLERFFDRGLYIRRDKKKSHIDKSFILIQEGYNNYLRNRKSLAEDLSTSNEDCVYELDRSIYVPGAFSNNRTNKVSLTRYEELTPDKLESMDVSILKEIPKMSEVSTNMKPIDFKMTIPSLKDMVPDLRMDLSIPKPINF